MTVRFDDVRDVGFFVFAAGWIVVVFANSGVIITDSLMIILGADTLIAVLPARKVERASHTRGSSEEAADVEADLMGYYTHFQSGMRTDAVIKNNVGEAIANVEWERKQPFKEDVNEIQARSLNSGVDCL